MESYTDISDVSSKILYPFYIHTGESRYPGLYKD